MATITLKISKDLSEYSEFLKLTQIDHLYNRNEQHVFGSEKVHSRQFFKKNDAIRTHNGCISCVVTVFGNYDVDYYFVIIANNKLDQMTYLGMCEKLIPFMVNKDEIEQYHNKKILINNDLYEHLND